MVIGTSLAEEQDIKPTPYLTYNGVDYLMPGVEIHANYRGTCSRGVEIHENYLGNCMRGGEILENYPS